MGEMKTHIEYIREKTDAINDKVDKVGVHSIRQGMQLDAFHDRIDETNEKHEQLKKTIDEHQSKLETLNGIKNKGIGFIAGASLVGGSIGAFLSKLLGIGL